MWTGFKKLPFPIRQGLKYIYSCVPLRLRQGNAFWHAYGLLKDSQWWSREELQEYQNRQLESLLNHAYHNVPYYRKIFDERAIKPKDIRSMDDLPKLPVLTKDIIRKNLNDLLSTNISPGKLYPIKTSGSTVSPLSFFWHKGMTMPREDGFIWTIWKIAGYSFNDRRLDLTWEINPDRLCQYEPHERVMKLSASALNEDILGHYLRVIGRFHPKILKSIPSNLVVLANHMKKNSVRPFPSIKVILCGSEMLYQWQRELIENAFQCRLFSFYGQTERVVLATECEVSRCYHVFPEYGVTEIIGPDNMPVKKEGQKGRIIGTGFNNYAMPFIRYEVGDIAVWTGKTCQCGRNYPLLQHIEGRENEYLISAKGELIPMIIIPYSSVMTKVEQFQFYQDTKGRVTVFLVPLPSYTKEDEQELISSLNRELKDMEITVKHTERIQRTDRGKQKYIIQKIPITFGCNSQ